MATVLLFLFITQLLSAKSAGPSPLQTAYDALRVREYDRAIASFRQAIQAEPARASIRKDFAYTLLKIGENEAARDQFGEAARLDPADYHAALEYAFLCYETKQKVEARRTFDRIRNTGDPESRKTAQAAFQNIDRPLAAGIARWQDALKATPGNLSAHQELARLAEERDELALAAEHYGSAWRLRPEERSLLLDLGRTLKALGRMEEANAALLAASRGAQPRIAERARPLIPARYPYVYEFRKALELDPKNIQLRRELAYLLLEMKKQDEAETEFGQIVEAAPDDLLSTAQLGLLRLARHEIDGAMPLLQRVLDHAEGELADRVRTALKLPQKLKDRPERTLDEVRNEAKTLAAKSLEAGYLKDALRYLSTAHEADPVDFDVILKLGWTNNLLKQDREALKWFGLARKSPDAAIASEATRAYGNLRPAYSRFRTTAWLFPMYSSRWRDLFSYGQVKTDFRIGSLPLRPYLSTRFVGDTRGSIDSRSAGMSPQYLSESSLIVGAGVATSAWRGLNGWFEAGEAIRYTGSRKDVGRMIPDYRGGLSFGRGFGHLLGPESRGAFAETNDDGVYISRFNHDLLLYSQNRTGYTFKAAESTGFQLQLYWNWNVTVDGRREYWANFVENGPGVRFRWKSLPRSMVFSVNGLRGNYLVKDGNPRGPVFHDLRIGFWYAFTH